MATPEVNENSHHVQNGPHRCKVKLENFILISCGVTELLKKAAGGGGGRNPSQLR